MFEDHQSRSRQRLERTAMAHPPQPWRLSASHPVGGLTEVGFAPDSELLLVISSQGRGLFDPATGARVARDLAADWEGLDQPRMTSLGIGPASDVLIRIAGLHGEGLPRSTADGWGLHVVPLPWPQHFIFLTRPWKTLLDDSEHCVKFADDGPCEFRACRFSDSGRSIAIATSCEGTMYHWECSIIFTKGCVE